jgi:hypothetical protein
MHNIHSSRQQLSHLRAVNATMKHIIDDSLGHLHEIYAFLGALESEPASPAVYIDDHPVCCGVPMWLTKMSIAEGARGGHACAEYTCQEYTCQEYTCQVCSKATTIVS